MPDPEKTPTLDELTEAVASRIEARIAKATPAGPADQAIIRPGAVQQPQDSDVAHLTVAQAQQTGNLNLVRAVQAYQATHAPAAD